MNSETNRVELTGDSCTCHAKESEQEYVIPVGSWKLELCSSAGRSWFNSHSRLQSFPRIAQIQRKPRYTRHAGWISRKDCKHRRTVSSSPKRLPSCSIK
jgi:hypothetical protein